MASFDPKAAGGAAADARRLIEEELRLRRADATHLGVRKGDRRRVSARSPCSRATRARKASPDGRSARVRNGPLPRRCGGDTVARVMLQRSAFLSACCALMVSLSAATASAEIVIPRPQAAPVEVQIEPAAPAPVTVPRSVAGTDEAAPPEAQLKLDEAARNAAGAEEQDLAAVGTAAGELLEALARSCLAGAFQVAGKDLAGALGLGNTINVDDELQKAFAACFTKQLTSQGVPAEPAQEAGASLGKALADDATAAAAAAADAQANGVVYVRWLGDTGLKIANPAGEQTAISTATAAVVAPNPVSGSATQSSSALSPGVIVAAVLLFGGAGLVVAMRRRRT